MGFKVTPDEPTAFTKRPRFKLTPATVARLEHAIKYTTANKHRLANLLLNHALDELEGFADFCKEHPIPEPKKRDWSKRTKKQEEAAVTQTPPATAAPGKK